MLLLLIIQNNRTEDINQLLNYFMSIGNPVFYSLLLVILIFYIVFSYFKETILPNETRIVNTKRRVRSYYQNEYQSFIDLDPDPVIKFDPSGRVEVYNKAARSLFPNIQYLQTKISELFPQIESSPGELYKKKDATHFSLDQNEKHFYGKLMIDNKYLGMVAHLHDSSAYFRYEQEYHRMQDDMQKLKIHLFNKMESEKRRIAAELHDGVGQIFSAAKLHINRLEQKDDENTIRDVYEKSIDLLSDGIQELKGITYQLRPKVLEELGLATAVETLVMRVVDEGFFEGSFDAFGDFTNLDPTLELTIYRLAQEGINNIVKHSQAKYFSIQLLNNENIIRLLISDNGIGFNTKTVLETANRQRGMGLLNMIERAETFGGTCEFSSELDNGTTVTIEMPVEKNNDT